MAVTETPNLKLRKPDGDEYVDVDVINANMDIIDNRLLPKEIASITKTGLIGDAADYKNTSYGGASWMFFRMHIPDYLNDFSTRGFRILISVDKSANNTHANGKYLYGRYDIEVYLTAGLIRFYKAEKTFHNTSYRPIYYTILARDSGNNILIGVSMTSAYLSTTATATRDITVSLIETYNLPYVEEPTDETVAYITGFGGVRWDPTIRATYPAASGNEASKFSTVDLSALGITQTGDLNYYDRLTIGGGYYSSGGDVYGYSVIGMGADNRWHSFNKGVSNAASTATTKLPSTVKFDLKRGIAYNASSSNYTTIGAAISPYMSTTTLNSAYLFNAKSGDANFPLAEIGSGVYYKGTIDEDGYFTVADLFIHCDSELNTLTEDNGYVYLQIGRSSPTASTTTIGTTPFHPIYYHDGTNLISIIDPLDYVRYKYSVKLEKVSQLENDAGYLTEHQSLSEYAKIAQIPTKLSQLEIDKVLGNTVIIGQTQPENQETGGIWFDTSE